MVKNVYWYSCEVSIILHDFNETWIFWTEIKKKYSQRNFMKLRPVGAEMFHADRRTDMTKLIVAFRKFTNVPNTTQRVLTPLRY